MHPYQLTLLIRPDIEEKDRQELLDALTKKLDKFDKQDLWGNRDLVYPIKHHKKAFFAHYEFEADPQIISAIDKNLRLNEDILRYLLIRRK